MVKPYLIQILKVLALLGADNNRIELSSFDLARQVKVSQQTASRYLLNLDRQEFIRREMGIRKQMIQILPRGMNILREEYVHYHRLFELRDEIQIEGTVISGMGEGKYYTEQDEYVRQFREKLSFTPYSGTLNISIEDVELNKLRMLRNAGGILIDGFDTADRSFGSVHCFKTKINRVSCAVVLPIRSHYSKVLEVISLYCLRDKLGLKDGDEVKLIVSLKN
jgi:riboflavin kinase